MQTAPPATAAGTSSRLGPVPTEKKQRSRSPAASASGVASSTTSSPPAYGTFAPADLAEANARTCSNPRSASSSSATVPTAPVAPTTPTRSSGMTPLRLRGCQLERLVQRPHRPLDVLLGHVEGDLDRRGRDELRLDGEVAQCGERER